MRLWRCDKCQGIKEGLSKPTDIVDVKIFIKAQSKGGKSIGCHLCSYCAKDFFKCLKNWKVNK